MLFVFINCCYRHLLVNFLMGGVKCYWGWTINCLCMMTATIMNLRMLLSRITKGGGGISQWFAVWYGWSSAISELISFKHVVNKSSVVSLCLMCIVNVLSSFRVLIYGWVQMLQKEDIINCLLFSMSLADLLEVEFIFISLFIFICDTFSWCINLVRNSDW